MVICTRRKNRSNVCHDKKLAIVIIIIGDPSILLTDATTISYWVLRVTVTFTTAGEHTVVLAILVP